MSFTYRVVGDALADLRDLPVQLQEAVLDELDALASDPFGLRADARGHAVHDFDRVIGNTRHVVFLRLHRDLAARRLTIHTIIDRPRPAPGA